MLMAELTEEEKRTLAKLIKCSRDITEFTDIARIVGPDGLEPISRRKYEMEWLEAMNGGKHACILAHKGSGKTVMGLLYALWYCFFHWDKRVAIVCRTKTWAWQLATWFWKMAIAIDMKYREQLPDLMEITDHSCKEPIVKFKFENKTQIFFAGPKCEELIGYTIDRLIFDEFDDMEELDGDNWINKWFPTMRFDRRIVVFSTPRGMKQMHRLWNSDDQSWIKIKSSWRETGLFSYRDIQQLKTYRSPVEIDNGYNCEFADMRDREYRKELMRR